MSLAGPRLVALLLSVSPVFAERVPMEIQQVYELQSEKGSVYTVRLTTLRKDEKLDIVIGGYEAEQIYIGWKGMPLPRPMPHDLMCTLLVALNSRFTRVVISDLKDGTFHARLYLLRGNREVAVDSRASDAIAVAMRARVPIFVERRVLEEAGRHQPGLIQ